MRRAAIVTLATCLALAAPASAQERPDCTGADAPLARSVAVAEDAVLCIVNAERVARALPPLVRDARLDQAAQAHSDDMMRRDYFDHSSPEGEGHGERASAAGYPWGSVYENIGMGYETARTAMEGWMQSTGHCQAVLAPEVADFGVGVTPGDASRWTQLFGLTSDAAPRSSDGAPAAGCPYQRLSIAPGPARITILQIGRGSRVAVSGRLEPEGGGRRIVVTARRSGRKTRRRFTTTADGSFQAVLRAPRGRGRVRVTIVAPAVPDVYRTGRARIRI